MQQERHPEYQSFLDLKPLLNDAANLNTKVIGWLEAREARENVTNGHQATTTSSNGVAAASSSYHRSRSSTATTKDSQDSVGDLIDGYGAPSPPTSPKTYGASRPPAVTTPSGGQLQSIAERMEKLRASGAAGVTPLQSNQRQPTSSRPPNPPEAFSAHSPPVKPPKPLGLSTGRTPPGSPSPIAWDLVEDSAGQRTGSAPPSFPQSEVRESSPRDSNGIVDRGPAGGVDVAPNRSTPYRGADELANSDRFPSLDDFERGVSGSSRTTSFPSAPSYDPSSSSSSPSTSTSHRNPPPQPPKPPLIDRATFEREQRERADKMAKLAAGISSSSYQNSPQSTQRPHTTSPLPPPTAGSSKEFHIPPSVEVRPVQLFEYLKTTKSESGEGPRVLLLDVRSRAEYEAGRIRGETVCLEPIVLRDGITSSQIEDALALSPSHEASLFAARQYYDLVIIYDRSSTALPQSPPTNTTSSAQRVLFNLTTAIYEREFSKSLKRQPMLLRGGWEAWEKQVGAYGSVGSGVQSDRRGSANNEADAMTKKAENRRAAVLPGRNGYDGSLVQTGASSTSKSIPYNPPSASTSNYPQSFSNETGMTPSGMVSPRLAMPPVAAQISRNGSVPEYDPFVPLSSSSAAHHQPQYGAPSYTSQNADQSLPSAVPRTRSDLPDLTAYSRGGNSLDYARPSIDYPQISSRSPPSVNQALRPHRAPPPPPVGQSLVPTVPLARPPLAKPAPMRSNSSFSSMHLPSYSSANSQFPTSMSFDDNMIGLTGLKNLGNTCYMNSTVQCLSAAVPFARYFKNGAYRKDVNEFNPLGTKGALANAVGELIRALWAQQYVYLAPVTFREAICRVAPQFRGTDQHDAQEFLGFLLDGLHEDCNYVLKKPPPIEMTPEREHDLETLPPQIMSEREWQIYKMRNDSFIVQCFQGQFRNQLKCLTCHKTSTTYNTFMPLSVPIPSHRGLHRVTLMSCLEAFVKDEILDKDDAWHCPRCKKNRKATKKLSLSKLPPILVIHLKRFSFHGPFSDKIETQVHYPLTGLDLTHFIPPPLMDQKSGSVPSGGFQYDLFGVTNHYGNLSSGHYTAFVRNGREWFNIGDSKVTACDPNTVQSAKSAYILYYAMR
ncbi:uncharacterized protein JCM6883_000088 [Sporobolomyces salmoneus]|uniref:uncharacterized protein n=1 Tax=Sporobolomyces salmoneus TaxID=183962 RepID=UPI00318212E1